MIFKINSAKIITQIKKSLVFIRLLINKEENTMKFNLRLLALLVAMLMVLTSCEATLVSLLELIPGFDITTTTTTTTTKWRPKPTTSTSTTAKIEDDTPTFNRADVSTSKSEMLAKYTLTKDEVDAALALLDSMVDASINAETIDEVDALYEEFETAFYHIAQQMTVASIIYYCDMSDEEASERNKNTTDMFYDLQDKYMTSCRTMYLESKFSEELFADWTEEELRELEEYDPAVAELKKEIKALEMEYDEIGYDWYHYGGDYDDAVTEVYIKLITKNNELARYYKYDNYYEYASVNVYGRDYDKEALKSFREYVVEYIAPNYSTVSKDFSGWRSLTEWKQNAFLNFVQNEKFDEGNTNYLVDYLNSLDGSMGEGMRHMFENKNCIFSNIGTSHPTAFQTYLYEDETPFCLFGSDGQTASTMVHEIGHYYAAYSNNDISNYDLCETHSQGNEFLFLKYVEGNMNKDVYATVKSYQLANTFTTIILSAVVDEFEQRVYALDSVEGMTSDDFNAIMIDVCAPYANDGKTGYEWVSSYLSDPNIYWRMAAVSNPGYYISYAVSAVAALEVSALAEADYDNALVAYNALVDGITPEDGFLGALEKAGLTSPFEEETYISIVNNLVNK